MLLQTFLDNISSDCAVKRRCSAQNCISLIEHARNRSLMARHGVNKVMGKLLGNGNETPFRRATWLVVNWVF